MSLFGFLKIKILQIENHIIGLILIPLDKSSRLGIQEPMHSILTDTMMRIDDLGPKIICRLVLDDKLALNTQYSGPNIAGLTNHTLFTLDGIRIATDACRIRSAAIIGLLLASTTCNRVLHNLARHGQVDALEAGRLHVGVELEVDPALVSRV